MAETGKQAQQEELSVSANKLIPSSYFDRLVYWRDTFSRGGWEIGDLTNEIYALALANGYQINLHGVARRVAQVVGKSVRSIELYSAVAGYYDPDQRDKYDVLPFSHFAYAMRQPDPFAVLDLSAAYLDKNGITPSVEQLAKLEEDYPDRAVTTGIYTPLTPSLMSHFPVPPLPASILANGGGNGNGHHDGEPDENLVRVSDVVNRLQGALGVIPPLLERLRYYIEAEGIVLGVSPQEIAVAVVSVQGLVSRIAGDEMREKALDKS